MSSGIGAFVKTCWEALGPTAGPMIGMAVTYGAFNHGKDIKKVAAKVIPSLGAVKQYTTDITEKARKAIKDGSPFDRAYGRERQLTKLISLLLSEAGGFAILVGSSGCGKSTIVNELAWRIEQGQEPLLKGHHILSMDSTKTGGSSIMDFMQNLLTGNMSSVVEEIIRDLETRYGKNQVYYLYFDEIQDFLQKNPKAFANLKSELAARGVHIIGASMNKKVVEEWIQSQEGMKRRAALIDVDSMNPIETANVLKELGSTLIERVKKKHPQLPLSIDASAIDAAIFLAKKCEPAEIDPARSVKFFSACVNSTINDHLKTSASNSLNIQQEHVFSYLANSSSHIDTVQIEAYKEELLKETQSFAVAATSVHLTTLDSFFPAVCSHQGKATRLIQRQADSLSSSILRDGHPVIVCRIASQAYTLTLIEYTQALTNTEGTSFVKCSLKELIKECKSRAAAADTFKRQLELTLQKLAPTRNKIVYIEDGECLLPHLDALKEDLDNLLRISPSKETQQAPKEKDLFSQFTPMVDQFASQIGSQFIGSPAKNNSASDQKTIILDAITQIFIQEINKSNLRVVIGNSRLDSSSQNFKNEINISLSDEEIKEWLINILPPDITTSDAEKIIRRTRASVDQFKLSSRQGVSSAQSCFLLLQNWLKEREKNSSLPFSNETAWIEAIFSLDRLNLKRDEIQQNLPPFESESNNLSLISKSHSLVPVLPLNQVIDWQVNFSYLLRDIPREFEDRMADFKQAPLDAPLCVVEDCHATREFRMAQMAAWLKDRSHKISYLNFSSNPYPQLPRVDLSGNTISPVLFIQGHELTKWASTLEEAIKNGYKVVIFAHSKDLPSQGSSLPMGDMIQAFVGNIMPVPTPSNGTKDQTPTLSNKWPKQTTYVSSELSFEENRLFLKFQMQTAFPKQDQLSDSTIEDFTKAYLFLGEDRGWKWVTLADEIRKDLPSLALIFRKKNSEINTDDVIDYFIMKPQLGKKRTREIVYAVSPSDSPYWYRAFRYFIKDPIVHGIKGLQSLGKKAYNLLTTPIGYILSSFLGPIGKLFQAISLFRGKA